MRRAIIALGFVLPCLAACATPRSTARPTVIVEPEPEQPAWTRMATAEDRLRIAALHDRLAAERAAASRRHAKGVAAETALVDPSAALVLPQLPPGPYYCRLLRFGGRAPFATFKPDFCYVEAGTDALYFTKQSGANLPEGWILPDRDTRQIFLGTFRRDGEPGGKHYGEDPTRDIAGTVERVSPFRWRLLLTRAGGGAALDLYELVPVPPAVPGAKPAVPEG